MPAAQDDLDLLLAEVNHRIRNLLAVVQAAVRQTKATTVEHYRAKLMGRVSSLRGVYEIIGRSDADAVGIAELLEQTMRPYCANGGRVFAAGPDIELAPNLAFALHLVFHELALNASKYGALSTLLGSVGVGWEIRHSAGAARQLAVFWNEQGGPEVKRPARFGFGSHLMMRALAAHGKIEFDFKPTGLVCWMLIDLDRAVSGRAF